MARIFQSETGAEPGQLPPAPLGGTRSQAVQRLQVGLGGVFGIVLLVGLAGLIQDRADQTERDSVPEAAPTNAPDPQPTGADPLVEAGVVPDLPATPTPEPQPNAGAPAQTGLPKTQPTAGDGAPQ